MTELIPFSPRLFLLAIWEVVQAEEKPKNAVPVIPLHGSGEDWEVAGDLEAALQRGGNLFHRLAELIFIINIYLFCLFL